MIQGKGCVGICFVDKLTGGKTLVKLCKGRSCLKEKRDRGSKINRRPFENREKHEVQKTNVGTVRREKVS